MSSPRRAESGQAKVSVHWFEPTAMLMDLLRAVFALAATLGLFALGVYAARRWGPKGLLQITAPGSRRLNIVESLSLDPSRRLVLVRLDGKDRLFLLGEGQELAPPSQPNASNAERLN